MAGPIRIAILADTRQATKTVSGFGDKVGKAAGVATVGLGLLAAGAIGAAGAAEKVAVANKRVGNVLSNMGEGAATDRVLKLAEAQEALTGVDDVLIKGAQAKLATFEAVAKSADVAGGAFDRATLASMDLAAAGFGSVEGNAVQLGKALQDPIKGLSALTRVGVTFTDAEKEKIKTLVESGKASQAQGIILGAVEKQVGGTAAATATDSAKMAAAVENITESIGGLLLPILTQITPIVQGFTETLAANPTVLLAIAGAVAAVATGIIVLNAVMKAYAAVQTLATALHVKQAAAWVASKVALVATTVATKAAAVGQWALNAAMTANPIGLVIAAIVALVAGLVWFFTQTTVGKKIVAGAWKGIQAAIAAVTNWWKNTAWPTIKAVWSSIVGAFQQGKEKVAAFMNGVKNVIVTVWKFSPLGIIISNWGRIIAWVKGIPGRVSSALGSLAGRLVSAGLSIINGFLSGLKRGFEAVKSFVGGIGSWIASHKGPRSYDLKLLVKNGGWIMTGLTTGLKKKVPELRKTLGTVARVVANADMGQLSAPGTAAGRRLVALTNPAVSADPGGATSSASQVVISFDGAGDPLLRVILNELRKYIRVNGGSVQTVLGRG